MRYGKSPAMMFDSALLPFLNLHQTTAKMMEEARRENAPMLKHMQAGKSFGVFWGLLGSSNNTIKNSHVNKQPADVHELSLGSAELC